MINVYCFLLQSRSVSMSTNMRDEIHPLPIVNAYAELNIPDLGIDINIPKDSDQQFQHYNKYRQISDEKVNINMIAFLVRSD